MPVIEIVDPADGGAALRRGRRRLGDVRLGRAHVAERRRAGCSPPSPDARAFGGAKVAAIGPGTAAALAAGNIRADLVPERFVAEALARRAARPGPGRVLLARAEVARDVLPDGLRARGWEVDVVDAYRTVPAAVTDEQRARGRDRRRRHLHLSRPRWSTRSPPSAPTASRRRSRASARSRPPRPATHGLTVDRRGPRSTPSTAWSRALVELGGTRDASRRSSSTSTG